MLRLAAVAVALIIWAASPAEAQDTPTDPPNILLRCHGYHEAGGQTRRYDCVPNPRDNARMETFVPAVGSPCNEGRVASGAQPRIFQVRCREGAVRGGWSESGSGPAILDLPTHIRRIRIEGRYDGSGENFVVWCGVSGDRGGLLVNEILGTRYPNTTYSGVHSALRSYGGAGRPCRELQVEHSVGLDWTIAEVAPSGLTVVPNRTLEGDLAAVRYAREQIRPQ